MAEMTGKVALITGGASGIGESSAKALARRGALAILADVDAERAAASAAGFRAEGLEAVGAELDVSDREGCHAVCRRLSERYGPISILVNNAGIVGDSRLGDGASPKEWDRAIDVNLTGVYNVTTACLDTLKAKGGVIINISSVVAFTSGLSNVGYIASKGGVRSLTQAMCRELSEFGIRVNAVAPGYIDTPMLSRDRESFDAWMNLHCPMKRYGTADEVGRVVAFLASDEASYVNGTTIPVDGGYLVI